MAMTEPHAALAAVRYTAAGTAWMETGQGEALVLVHGVGMNRAVWTPQIEAFARDYHVIAYDMLGHGDSPLPSAEAPLPELADQLGELLDALGIDQAHLVGHSMGGLVVLDFALRAPGRVRDLVVLNGVYQRSDAQRAAVSERARELARAEPNADASAVEATLERWFGPHGQVAPAQLAQVRHWLEEAHPVGYARVYARFARADRALVGRLPSLEPRALFVTGELDPNSTPAMARRMAEEAPTGETRIVAGQRHMMAFAEPATVNPLLFDFLHRAGADNRAAQPGASCQRGV